LCREEAQKLSSLLPILNAKNIRLIGVVHEELGAAEFAEKFFVGPIYLDSDRSFFKALGNRWLGLTGFFKIDVWKNIFRAKQIGIEGNMKGEGRLLGGLLVIGPGDQGVIFEHREQVWGDHANLDDVLAACEKIREGN